MDSDWVEKCLAKLKTKGTNAQIYLEFWLSACLGIKKVWVTPMLF